MQAFLYLIYDPMIIRLIWLRLAIDKNNYQTERPIDLEN